MAYNKVQLFSRYDYFVPFYGVADSDYLSLPRNQLSKGNSFIFSILSCIEIAYGLLTGTRLLLSAEQVTQDLYNFYGNNNLNDLWINSYCKEHRDQTVNSGDPLCTLAYIQQKGIMSEYDFPYEEGKGENKYDSKLVMPINVTDISSITIQKESDDEYKLVNILNPDNPLLNGSYDLILQRIFSRMRTWFTDVKQDQITPIAAYVCSSLLKNSDRIIDTVDEDCEPDQLVAVTAIGCIGNNDKILYAEIINSNGKDIGQEGKFYLKITDENTIGINNGNIFSRLTFFKVLHDPDMPFKLSNAYDECPKCEIEFPDKRKTQYSFVYISSIIVLCLICVILIIQILVMILNLTGK